MTVLARCLGGECFINVEAQPVKAEEEIQLIDEFNHDNNYTTLVNLNVSGNVGS